MKSLRFCFLIISTCFLFWGAGCSSSLIPVSKPQSFFLPDSFTNYQSAGRVLLVTPDQKVPGELEFSLSRDLELRFQVFAPIIGTLVYEFRANKDQFMILDFREKKYFLDDNDSQTRQQWFGIDISLNELRWVVWGRIPRQEFEQHQGHYVSSKSLKFTSKEAEFFVTLDANGIMSQLIKEVEGVLIYKVSLQKYQEIEGNLFPKVIQIISPLNQGKLRLVMNEIRSQPYPPQALTFLPGEGMTPFQDE
ncbi:MAG: DUF4292 domain-containing protein [SAR324 cluster bacterium]|nr:DUF4292 domain-containing protein [SAR324 cluster bacterium]